MIKLKIGVLLSCLIVLTSCKVQKIDKKFYNNKTVGVAVMIEEPKVSFNNSSIVYISRDKYDEKFTDILKEIEISKDSLTQIITNNLKANNKKYKFIEDFNYYELSKFKSRNPDRLKEYSRRELRNFKKSHNIDEIIVLRISYGVHVQITQLGIILYYGAFEYKNEMVDLEDNSLYQRKFNTIGNRIKDHKTPENVKNAIYKGMAKGFTEITEIYK